MKKILTLSFILLFFVGSFGFARDRVQIEPINKDSFQAGAINYTFKLLDQNLNKEIGDQDLTETHTKKIHLLAYDPALKEFNHTHPSFDGTKWSVELNLPTNGNYFIWAQGELSDGTEFSILTRAVVTNGKIENPILPLADIRIGTDTKTILELSKTKIKPGKMTMLTFKVTRSDGATPIMTPYLGALAHIIATPASGDDLLHVHPMEDGEQNSGMIHATFPKEGSYRLWIQFIEHDELKTIPISVIVTK